MNIECCSSSIVVKKSIIAWGVLPRSEVAPLDDEAAGCAGVAGFASGAKGMFRLCYLRRELSNDKQTWLGFRGRLDPILGIPICDLLIGLVLDPILFKIGIIEIFL